MNTWNDYLHSDKQKKRWNLCDAAINNTKSMHFWKAHFIDQKKQVNDIETLFCSSNINKMMF